MVMFVFMVRSRARREKSTQQFNMKENFTE